MLIVPRHHSSPYSPKSGKFHTVRAIRPSAMVGHVDLHDGNITFMGVSGGLSGNT